LEEKKDVVLNRERGFTLIELLVVIAIIALLMAILMPALNKAKEQAKGIVCRSKLKEFGTAANMYADDYDQKVPRGTAIDADENEQMWFMLFMPYLAVTKKTFGDRYDPFGDMNIYRCPSYPDKKQALCYVINNWEFAGNDDYVGKSANEDKPAELSLYRHLSRTIYIADNEDAPWRKIVRKMGDRGTGEADIQLVSHLPYSDEYESALAGRRVARRRHGKGYNALFFDWHTGHISTTGADYRGGLSANEEINLWKLRR
jgi:prepilin-type N-terminal cleavage/methylation domain-containing protein/prepilin-type processing-associated H-X9-DG protein